MFSLFSSSRFAGSLYAALSCACFLQGAYGQAPPNPYPQGRVSSSNPLEVDLGYATYVGVANELNEWFGIRYAEAPIGPLRWQRPEAPKPTSNGTVFNASTSAVSCPQAPDHVSPPSPFAPSAGQSEDCLFLNVWAPPNAENLPVFVWIHGGGYGSGSATCDMDFFIDSSKEPFVGVAIQYRLAAFGFLSSDDVHDFGTPNAGLYDQYLALQWVQNYISLFGGDPSNVTIAGESAGGGSVMMQSMAFGGSVGEDLFNQVWAASPYLPQQYNYGDSVPTQRYYDFAAAAGCYDSANPNATQQVFQCLVGQDTEILQNASYTVTVDYKFGQWAFLPVTDGVMIQDRPSSQLPTGRINGKRALIGNNADEGEMFTPQNVTTEEGFVEFVKWLFPYFKESDVQKVLKYYPITTAQEANTARFATDGVNPNSTAVTESPFATGQQQRANNLYAETTFVCPAQWMAEAFSTNGHEIYKYQFSILTALHGDDLFAYFTSGDVPVNMGQSFRDAMISFLNSFITTGTPNTESVYNTTVPADTAKFMASWPAYNTYNQAQANLNQTGGVLNITTDPRDPFDYPVAMYVNPGLEAAFNLVNAYTWEGGRGERCDFWKSVGTRVPEKRSQY